MGPKRSMLGQLRPKCKRHKPLHRSEPGQEKEKQKEKEQAPSTVQSPTATLLAEMIVAERYRTERILVSQFQEMPSTAQLIQQVKALHAILTDWIPAVCVDILYDYHIQTAYTSTHVPALFDDLSLATELAPSWVSPESWAIAAHAGNIVVLQYLHANNVAMPNPSRTCLFRSTAGGCSMAAAKFLHDVVKLKVQSPDSLDYVIQFGSMEMIRYFDSISTIQWSREAISDAITFGNIPALRFFHEEKKIALLTSDLSIATATGSNSAVDYLMENGITVEWQHVSSTIHANNASMFARMQSSLTLSYEDYEDALSIAIRNRKKEVAEHIIRVHRVVPDARVVERAKQLGLTWTDREI